jgi:hypothetical protein
VALLVLLGGVIWPVRHFGYVEFDDPQNVFRERHVLGGPTAQNFHWALRSYQMGHWVPLTRLTYLLDQRFFNLNPGVMHVEDVLLHIVGSVLVYVLLVTMTGAIWRSCVVAILFAVHPMHVESVAWITERRDVLSTPLLLMATLAYVRFARVRGEFGKWLWYATALILYALSLTAKAMGTTLPVILLLLDFWPLRRMDRPGHWRKLLMEKVPFLILAVADSIPAVQAQRAVGAAVSVAAEPVSARIANAGVTYVLYLWKLVIPTGLSAMYPLPPEMRSPQQVLLSLLLLTGLVGSAWIWRRRWPYLLVGLGWFLLTLLPVSGLVQSGPQAMADRYSYLPSIGFFIVIAWGAWDAARAMLGNHARHILTGGCIIVAIALAATARVQVRYWQTTRMLFDHANQVTEGNYFAQYQIGVDEARHQHYHQAMDLLAKVIRENPGSADAYIDYGNCLYLTSPASALPLYDQAVRLEPHNIRARLNRANARQLCGDAAGAAQDRAVARQLDPD